MPVPFQKGHHIGSPKGIKRSKWTNETFWFNRLNREYKLLEGKDKVKVCVDMLRILRTKAANEPVKTADKALSPQDAARLLESLESKASPVAEGSTVPSPTVEQPNVEEIEPKQVS